MCANPETHEQEQYRETKEKSLSIAEHQKNLVLLPADEAKNILSPIVQEIQKDPTANNPAIQDLFGKIDKDESLKDV